MQQKSSQNLNQYFERAFNWHYAKYILPKRHRAFIALLTIISIFFAWVILKLTLIDITVEKIPFPIYYGKGITSYPSIQKISSNSRDINRGIAKYLLTDYINVRESYSRKVFEEKNWNKTQKQMRGFSSREVYSQYLSKISTKNQNSPYFLYLRNRVRGVKIEDITLNKSNNYAEVQFTTLDTDNGLYERHFYTAKVGYFVSDAQQVQLGNLKFKFLITSYEIVENNA